MNVLQSDCPEDIYQKVADTIPTIQIKRDKDSDAKIGVVEVLTEKLASNIAEKNGEPTAEEINAAREASKEPNFPNRDQEALQVASDDKGVWFAVSGDRGHATHP